MKDMTMKGKFNDLVDVSVICVLAVVPLAIMAVFFYGLFSLMAPKACSMEMNESILEDLRAANLYR
jgi:hypothetical protein